MEIRILLSLVLCSSMVQAGRFLFYYPLASKSHKIAYMPLVNELANRGHEVTIICPHASKKPKPGVTEILIQSDFDAFGSEMSDGLLANNMQYFPLFKMTQIALETNEAALTHPEVVNLLAGDIHYDVTVVAPFFLNEAGYYISHKLNSSLVLFFSSSASLPWMNWAGGNVHNPSYMPMIILPYSSHMTLWERLINTVALMGFTFGVRDMYLLPKVDGLLAKLFPNEEILNLKEVENNAALSITVGNPFIGDGLRPVLPNTILAGFMFCLPGKSLPKNLQEWIEGAEHGVVYVSFGSVLKSSVMPKEKRDIFVSVLGSLRQRVIWKWEAELPNQPENILTSAWLPQTNILAHPNVKLFITHGGTGSIQETICHKTPVVGIPFSGDQYVNLFDAEDKGFGCIVNWMDVTQESLKKGITTVLENEKYSAAVHELGELVMDQPQHPLDRAIWWMEYILRHPGNKKMKSPVHDLWWYQYFLLDVILLIVVIIGLVAFIIFNILKMCLKKIKGIKNKIE